MKYRFLDRSYSGTTRIMNTKVHICHFTPYFPPHIGWVEQVVYELALGYMKTWYGEVIIICYDIGQEFQKFEKIHDRKGNIIGYLFHGIKIYLLPGYNIIPNFPIPQIWKKQFYRVWKTCRNECSHIDVIYTHTRFFTTTLLWAYVSKSRKIPWIHIEHGSDFVKWNTKMVTLCAYIYDIFFWKMIFLLATRIVAVSSACKSFIQRYFVKREIQVIHNPIDFHPAEKIIHDSIHIAFIGRIVELKWVDLFLKCISSQEFQLPHIKVSIVGEGPMRKNLEKKAAKNVTFYGYQTRATIAQEILPSVDILVNPSYQEWLPTTVIEWLLARCCVVASDVWGTSEISKEKDLILFQPGSLSSLQNALWEALKTYLDVSGKSYNTVSQAFLWDKIIEQYFHLSKNL